MLLGVALHGQVWVCVLGVACDIVCGVVMLAYDRAAVAALLAVTLHTGLITGNHFPISQPGLQPRPVGPGESEPHYSCSQSQPHTRALTE